MNTQSRSVNQHLQKTLVLIPLLTLLLFLPASELYSQDENGEPHKKPVPEYIVLDPEKLNNPEEVPIEYLWGLLDASQQGRKEFREEIVKRSLEGDILAMSFLSEIPGIYKDGRIYETLMQQIQVAGLKNNRYYSYGSNILSALQEMDLSDQERAVRLAEFKELYRNSYSYMHFEEAADDPYLMAVAERSIDIIRSERSSAVRDSLYKKYGRYPQKFEFYLTVPEIVNIYFESFNLIRELELYKNDSQLRVDFDLPFLISASMAEGYILNARYFIRGTEMFKLMNYPMGLDRFGNTLPELKRRGYLKNDFDGFVYDGLTFTQIGMPGEYKTGEFKSQEDLFLGFAALFFQDRAAFIKDLKMHNYQPDDLNRDQRRVGSVLRMVSGYTGDHLKKYGPDLTGRGKRHGDGLHNAQWAPATAEYLELMYGDIFKAYLISKKPDVNALRIELYSEPYLKCNNPRYYTY